MEEVMKPHTLADTSRGRHHATAYAYGCPPFRRNSGAVAARNQAAHRSQETPVQADTGRARNQEGMVNRWSEETAEQVAARGERDHLPNAERRSEKTTVQSEARKVRDLERAANRPAGESNAGFS